MTAAVLLHPHPDLGGNQYNHVITALYDGLTEAGITPYRFDFASSDLGAAQAQTLEAIEAAGEPVFLIGYSFGGGVAATVAHPAIVGWGLVAPALTLFEPVIGTDPRPKHVVVAERDAWFGPDTLAQATTGWAAATQATVAGADHFFGGFTADRAADLVTEWCRSVSSGDVGHDQ